MKFGLIKCPSVDARVGLLFRNCQSFGQVGDLVDYDLNEVMVDCVSVINDILLATLCNALSPNNVVLKQIRSIGSIPWEKFSLCN